MVPRARSDRGGSRQARDSGQFARIKLHPKWGSKRGPRGRLGLDREAGRQIRGDLWFLNCSTNRLKWASTRGPRGRLGSDRTASPQTPGSGLWVPRMCSPLSISWPLVYFFDGSGILLSRFLSIGVTARLLEEVSAISSRVPLPGTPFGAGVYVCLCQNQ